MTESTSFSPTLTPTMKKCSSTYSRRQSKIKESTVTCSPPPTKVTSENFALKMLEVMRPVHKTFLPNPSSDTVDDDDGDDDGDGDGDGENLPDEKSKRRCVKNVHELLTLGLSERFLEELDYIVSGLEELPSQSKSNLLRLRSKYIKELTEKLELDRPRGRSSIQESILRSSGLIQRISKALEQATVLKNEGENNSWNNQIFTFMLQLLYSVCFDVRRVDYFASPAFILKIVKMGLNNYTCDGERIYSSNEKSIDDGGEGEGESLQEKSIWLLAKYFLAKETSSAGERGNSFDYNFENSSIIDSLLTILTFKWLSDTTRGRILYIFANFVNSGHYSLRMARGLIELITRQREGLAITSAALGILITLTGPDPGAALVANDEEICCQSFNLLNHLVTLDNEGVKIAMLTYITNIVDRSIVSRFMLFQHSQSLSKLAYCMKSSEKGHGHHYGLYCGVLIGITLYDLDSFTRSQTLKIHDITPFMIKDCFFKLKAHLSNVNMLNTEIEEQLARFAQPYQ